MFEPTVRQTKIWFTKLNNKLFGGELPRPMGVEIRRRRDIWGECAPWYVDNKFIGADINLTNKFRSKEHFLSILAHEMVHLYQFTVGDTAAHNEMFYSFRETFEENDLVLKREY